MPRKTDGRVRIVPSLASSSIPGDNIEWIQRRVAFLRTFAKWFAEREEGWGDGDDKEAFKGFADAIEDLEGVIDHLGALVIDVDPALEKLPQEEGAQVARGAA